MLTALAHLILACSRSRSLIADSIRDEPQKWHVDGDYLKLANGLLVVYNGGCYMPAYTSWPDASSKRELGWAERRLIRRAAKHLVVRDKAKAARQFEKALKAALTGDE